jgi:hypothetical protein
MGDGRWGDGRVMGDEGVPWGLISDVNLSISLLVFLGSSPFTVHHPLPSESPTSPLPPSSNSITLLLSSLDDGANSLPPRLSIGSGITTLEPRILQPLPILVSLAGITHARVCHRRDSHRRCPFHVLRQCYVKHDRGSELVPDERRWRDLCVGRSWGVDVSADRSLKDTKG